MLLKYCSKNLKSPSKGDITKGTKPQTKLATKNQLCNFNIYIYIYILVRSKDKTTKNQLQNQTLLRNLYCETNDHEIMTKKTLIKRVKNSLIVTQNKKLIYPEEKTIPLKKEKT